MAWPFLPPKCSEISRHSKLNAFIMESLSLTDIPSVSESGHHYMTDKKRQDVLTLVLWSVGKQLLRDVPVVDSQAPSRINGGSVCNHELADADSEEQKNAKF